MNGPQVKKILQNKKNLFGGSNVILGIWEVRRFQISSFDENWKVKATNPQTFERFFGPLNRVSQSPKKRGEESDDDLDDAEEEEDYSIGNSSLIKMGKKLMVKIVVNTTRNPNHYLHVFCCHLKDYLSECENLSRSLGFRVGLKEFAQDAIEAHHK